MGVRPRNIRIARYKKTDSWEVWVDDELLVASCTKEMAWEIKRNLSTQPKGRVSPKKRKKRSSKEKG